MASIESSAQAGHEQSWFLETISGPLSGQKDRLLPGRTMHFGRRTGVDSAHPHDGHMSGLHFAADFDGVACKIKDLNSRNGTFVNGTRIQAAVLNCNDLITAGETTFALGCGGRNATAAGPLPAGITAPQAWLLSLLRNHFQPLFAIIDSARDRYAYTLLLQSQAQYQSLYDGEKGVSLSDVAPYLVHLPKDSELLPILVRDGWGQSWGVYLKSLVGFQEVRRHLRHFLEVRQPDGEQLYFRFYDPRVLRAYLPTLTPNEAAPFMGPIHCYLAEDQKPNTLLQFMNTGQGAAKAAIPLDKAKAFPQLQ